MCVHAVHVQACKVQSAKCNHNIACSLEIMKGMTFEICYSVAQKWRILANVDKTINFWELLGRYWDWKQFLKAKILNQVLPYNKVAVATTKKVCAVADAEGFWVAELQVQLLKIGRKSCFAYLLYSCIMCAYFSKSSTNFPGTLLE